MGYVENYKAYILLNLDFNVIVESRYVNFIENKFSFDLTTQLEFVYDTPCDIAPVSYTSIERKEL